MALSPLKSPSGGFSRRRRGFNFTWLWVALGAVLLYGGWQLLFGFHSAVESTAKAIRSGHIQQAGQDLSKLKVRYKDNPRVIEVQGLLENYLGRPEIARDLYFQAINLGLSASKSLDHLDSGQHFLDQGAYPQAEAEYRHAVNLDPNSANSLLGLGWVLQARGDYKEAAVQFDKATDLDPSLEAARKASELAKEAIARGTHFYMYDTDEEPLARATFDKDGFHTRSYPLAQFAAHITGTTWDKVGSFGLEKTLEDLLPQNSVHLTLNSRLHRLVSKHMGWRKGSVVILNPKTGDILAAVNQPSFNPNETTNKNYYKIRGNRNKPLKDRAFEGLYEPGSICKIITAAAALETHIDLSKIFPKRNPPAVQFSGKWFRDWKDHGTVKSLKHAMDVSSNIALAYVAFELGADRHYEFTNRFGFGEKFDLGFTLPNGKIYSIPVAQSTAPLSKDDKYSLAERACGLGTTYRMSPLHAAMMVAAVANKGVMMKPRLIKSINNISGKAIVETHPEESGRVMTEDTAERLKEIMIDTVENGIGQAAKVEGVKVAGKTGTSRTIASGQLDAWFIAFAPADDPTVAIAVLGEQEGQGMKVAAPIAGDILRDWIR